MLRGRFDDEDEKNKSNLPDRLIHFEPDESVDDANEEPGSVFETYYKSIAPDSDNTEEKVLFNKSSEDDGKTADDEVNQEQTDSEYSPVVYRKEDSDEQNLADSSFPIFVSFNAGDSVNSVSEVLRKKAAQSTDSHDEAADSDPTADIKTDHEGDPVTDDDTKAPYDPTDNEIGFDHIPLNDDHSGTVDAAITGNDHYNYDDDLISENDPFDITLEELDVPVFKPVSPPSDEDNSSDSYDIPGVFDDNRRNDDGNDPEPDDNTGQDFASGMPSDDNPNQEPAYNSPVDEDFTEETAVDSPADEYFAEESAVDSPTDEDFAEETAVDSPADAEQDPALTDESMFEENILDETDGSSTTDEIIKEPTASDNDKSVPFEAETDSSVASGSGSDKKFFDDFDDVDIMEIDSSSDVSEGNTNHLLDENIISETDDQIESEETVRQDISASAPFAQDSAKAMPQDKSYTRSKDDSVASVLRDDGIKVFKDSSETESSQPVSSIPKRSRVEVKERPGRQYSEKKDDRDKVAPVKGVQPLTNLDRPGSRYTAAQQMGTVTPQRQRKRLSKKSVAEYLPLVILIALIVLGIAFFIVWNQFNLGAVFAGLFGGKNDETGVTTFSADPTITSVSEMTSLTAAPSLTDAVTPTPSSTPTPSATPTPTPSSTPTPSPAPDPDAITRFKTKIINGSSNENIAYFDLNFENTGGNDSSLYDSIKKITLTYSASVTFDEVQSSFFTFTKKEGTNNTFIGTPTSTELIKMGDEILVDISAITDDGNVGSFKITSYYIEYND